MSLFLFLYLPLKIIMDINKKEISEFYLNNTSDIYNSNRLISGLSLFVASSDELPVQLSLPRAMREAKNRQQLSSLALLGQEFWRYPMANPKLPESSSSNTSSLSSFHGGEQFILIATWTFSKLYLGLLLEQSIFLAGNCFYISSQNEFQSFRKIIPI